MQSFKEKSGHPSGTSGLGQDICVQRFESCPLAPTLSLCFLIYNMRILEKVFSQGGPRCEDTP